jgi:hypothetical protein
MRKLFYPVLLLLLAAGLYSFAPGEVFRDDFKAEGSINATINGELFKLRENSFYRATLVNKPVPFATSADASRSKVAANLMFYGVDSTNSDGRFFSDNIGIDFTFSNNYVTEITDATDVGFDLHYNFADYYMLPENNSFKITRIDWSSDKTSFRMSADFDCVMHRRGYSDDVQPTVQLKGTISDIKVDVPPWIAARFNKAQAAGAGQ